MHTTYMWQPVAKGKHKVDKVEVFIGLLPFGKENAIKRSDLVHKCVEAGIVNASSKDMNQDRAMRKIMQRAKVDYRISITNDGKGDGYYRPTKEDEVRLSDNNDREDKKAISTFKSNKINKAFEEDCKRGRFEEVEEDA